MGCRVGYFQFFRFRTPPEINQIGVRDRWLWLARSFENLDFNYEVFLKEAFAIGTYTPVFTYQDLKEMPFDHYSIIVGETRRIHRESEKD